MLAFALRTPKSGLPAAAGRAPGADGEVRHLLRNERADAEGAP
jgi:hypothetical protein